MEKQLEFPMDIYPPPLRQIFEDTHRDLNFSVSYIAASLLLAVSVVLGNSRVLKVRDGWRVKIYWRKSAGQADPYRTGVRLARLCFQMLKTSRWSPRFAGGKDVFTHLRINTLTHLYANVRFYNSGGR